MLLKNHLLHIVAMGDFFMRNDLTASGVYIAAVIGAGFASGSEIVYYFAKYGKISIFGVMISALLFGLSAWAVLNLSAKLGAESFGEFLVKIFPKSLAKVINISAVVFMFFVFAAMVAGSGETLCELVGTKKSVGVAVILVLTVAVLMFDVRGLMAANGVMSVFIILGVLGVCFYLYNFREINVFSYKGEWAVSGTLYTGYNILTAGAVLPSMSRHVHSSKRVGIVSGVCIFVLLGALWGIISIYHGKIPLGAIPMLTICKRHGYILSVLYSAVLFLAMLTTALANGFAITDAFLGNRNIKTLFVAALGFLFAAIPFDFFVGSVYRWAGYVGVFFMFRVLIKSFKKINYLEKRRKIK